ncbi:non-homologous end-joining DNA ligase [Amycolatopsis carbonis]|uniref:Non-homologous end-joining DNA ligase n=1 Tax=Amycolatopsis carbonis TaxID=715471 RepID=A0A9Y2N1J6_9PSEU|nr:non-homologous end-joining DNA ligase [Amycolatopsis sp. 2-15]WIX83052.1 non-homologous end-joining DNA ligase [Amycolatopsis sp. 2-15]
MPEKKLTVQVGERRLVLSNLDKPLYPSGYTKGEVVHYYTRVAPILLAHVRQRPITMVRFPDGTDGEAFFEKNCPRGAPEWVQTVTLPSSGSRSDRGPGTITYPLIEDLPSLVWAANLAALELHVPQWTVGPGPKRQSPDRLVFDLDPGEGASVVECARVAERLLEVLTADGLAPLPKTSGSKGLQICCGVRTRRPDRTSTYAKAIAEQLAAEMPELVVSKMAKALRTNKVLIDWGQNHVAKTTIAPYSLRGRATPTVSTPITWNEVRACRTPAELTFTAADVLHRVDEHGDLLTELETSRVALPANDRR